MNVLEALKLVDLGSIIRLEVPEDDVYYIFMCEILPFKEKEITILSLWGQKIRGKFPPKSFQNLSYLGDDSLSLDSVRSNEFKEVTYQEVLDEIRIAWKEHNKDKYPD